MHDHRRTEHQRQDHGDDVHLREVRGNASRRERAVTGGVHGDIGGQRCAKQAGVEEGLHLIHAEDVVRGVTGLLDAHAELASALAGAVEGTQHVEQANEDRHLNQHRKAGRHRTDAHLLLSLAHLNHQLLLIIGVLALEFLHLRLELLHLSRGAELVSGGLDQQNTDGHHEEDDGKRPRGTRGRVEHIAEHFVPEPQDR